MLYLCQCGAKIQVLAGSLIAQPRHSSFRPSSPPFFPFSAILKAASCHVATQVWNGVIMGDLEGRERRKARGKGEGAGEEDKLSFSPQPHFLSLPLPPLLSPPSALPITPPRSLRRTRTCMSARVQAKDSLGGRRHLHPGFACVRQSLSLLSSLS